jgi:hypothetical protein
MSDLSGPPRMPYDCQAGHAYFDEDCLLCVELAEELEENMLEGLGGHLSKAIKSIEGHTRKMQAADIAAEVSGGCFNCELHRDSNHYVQPVLAHLGSYVEWMSTQGSVMIPETLGNTIEAFQTYTKHYEVPKVRHLKKINPPQKRDEE